MQGLKLTRHAAVRSQQRALRRERLELFMQYADREVSVGRGCFALRCSRKLLRDRDLRRRLGPQLDLLRDLTVICACDTGEVVTVMHDHGGPKGRHYRR